MQNPKTYLASFGRTKLLREGLKGLKEHGLIRKDREGNWQITKRGQAVCREAEQLEQKIVEQNRKGR